MEDVRSTAEDDPAIGWVVGVSASDLCEPLGGGRYLLKVTLDDLAVHLGYTRRSGSLSRQLRRLESAGILASRRPVIFDIGHRRPDPSSHREGAPLQHDGDTVDVLARLAADAFAAGDATLSRRALDALCSLTEKQEDTSSSLDPSRARRATEKKSSSPSSSAPSAASSRPSTSPYQAHPAAVPTARTRRSSGRIAVSGAGRVPSADRRAQSARIDTLLAPLLDECSRRGLPGISGRAGVVDALHTLSDDAVRRGVHMVCAQLAAGTPVRSPVGLLVALARRGDLIEAPEPSVAPPPGEVATPPDEDTTTDGRPALDPVEWLGVVNALMQEHHRHSALSSEATTPSRSSS